MQLKIKLMTEMLLLSTLMQTMSSAVSSSASKEDPSTLDAKFVLEEVRYE
jgi:hypothetical protein